MKSNVLAQCDYEFVVLAWKFNVPRIWDFATEIGTLRQCVSQVFYFLSRSNFISKSNWWQEGQGSRTQSYILTVQLKQLSTHKSQGFSRQIPVFRAVYVRRAYHQKVQNDSVIHVNLTCEEREFVMHH